MKEVSLDNLCSTYSKTFVLFNIRLLNMQPLSTGLFRLQNMVGKTKLPSPCYQLQYSNNKAGLCIGSFTHTYTRVTILLALYRNTCMYMCVAYADMVVCLFQISIISKTGAI